MPGAARGPPRSGRPDGLPLRPGRRGGAAQHQRVAAAAPAGVARGVPRRAGRASTSTATPTARRPSCGPGPGREPRGPARPGLLRQRLQRGAAVPAAGLRRARAGRWPCSSRPTPCTRTSPSSPAPRWSAGSRTDDFLLDLDEVSRVLAAAQPGASPSSARPTTRPGGPSPSTRSSAVLDHGARAWWWSTRPTGSSPRPSALDLVRAARPAPRWWWSGPSPRPGRWPGCGSATWSARPTVVDACELVALPYHLDAVKQLAGRLALRFVDEMEARVAMLNEERRPDRRRPGRPAGRDLAVGRQLHPVPARPAPEGHGGVAGPARPRRCSCETVRSGPASPGACGSRWALPRRTTGSSPP